MPDTATELEKQGAEIVQAAREYKIDNPKELRFVEAPGITTQQGKPIYYVMREVDGRTEPVLKGDRPVRWTPDWNSSPEKAKRDKKLAEDRAEKLRRAQAGREGFLENIKNPPSLYDGLTALAGP